jgi:phosphopantothenoylcysteine decarboxylase/phosphopantothenate--cysteine ligase
MTYLKHSFFLTRKLAGKKVLVTAGPTYEPIDPVRFIGNHSSGKMGIALAEELYTQGAEVTLVLGPTQLTYESNGIHVKKVSTAEEMYQVCDRHFNEMDIAVMAAAVADYTPVNIAEDKIKKSEQNLQITLQKTTDILQSLGSRKKENQVLIGFALETKDEEQNALEKMKKKNTDMIVLNSLKDAGAGFGYNTNKITIFDKSGEKIKFETKSKKEVAKDIVDTLIRLYYE